MPDAHSQMAKALADGMTASVSAPGTYTLGGNLNTITNGGYTFSNTAITNNGAVSGTLNAGPYTYTATTGISNTVSPKIRLDGKGADIEVNGWSLVGAIKKIEERLNILTPNVKLETEWAELQELGEQYRKLEQHIKDKQATWDRLTAMVAPEID